jgi:hypothetical protein
MKTTFLKTALAAAALLACQAASAAAPAYVASTWNDQSVHLLDASMNDLYSFSVASDLPNGIAVSSSLIFAGHFTDSSIAAYDYSGALQFTWSDYRLGGLQGLALVGNDLVVAADGTSYFFNATTGAYQHEFSNSGNIVEGLTYDGQYLWELGNGSLVARDAATGEVVRNLDNVAESCSSGGAGLAGAGTGALMLACASGDWYKVDSMTGEILDAGNNQLDMYGLDSVSAVPEPESYAMMLAGIALMGVVARRRKAA